MMTSNPLGCAGPFALAIAGLTFAAIAVANAADAPPSAPREFRAAWVATVANIDWPSKPGLSTADQQREAIAILDRCADLNLNAVVLQVRPAADAFYESKLEPWSGYLTGKQGQAPEPHYDPLAFWVEEAHKRGLQLHAWFNPYRSRQAGAKYEDAPNHVSQARPDLNKKYGNLQWLDPGEPEAQEHTLAVILDVVKRYDVDGVHFDDYFYPYPIADEATKKEIDFPDEPSWQKYRSSGGKLARADWRRDNINRLVERLYAGIKAEKPWVLLGISPFGIPRPGQPEQAKGFDQYDKLYADTLHWLDKGWCDYFSPQLYWKVDAPGQPFRPLLDYWIGANTQKRHIWPGLSVSRVGDAPNSYAPEEILKQLEIIGETNGSNGAILFSMKALMANRRGLADRLKDGPFHEPALVPASPWLGDAAKPPGQPTVKAEGPAKDGKLTLTVEPGPGPAPFVWSVAVKRGDAWAHSVYPVTKDGKIVVDVAAGTSTAVISAVDRLGLAGKPAAILPAPQGSN